uniref:Uncharacterized protein n=1 Tax=Glossina pallidipes TaxID=7398 RepID=A0A1A9Z7D0_GLOPL
MGRLKVESDDSFSIEGVSIQRHILKGRFRYEDKARIGDIIWTVCLLSLFGNQQSAFNKVSLANTALTALRLHQRLPIFTLPCEFLAQQCTQALYLVAFKLLNITRQR